MFYLYISEENIVLFHIKYETYVVLGIVLDLVRLREIRATDTITKLTLVHSIEKKMNN